MSIAAQPLTSFEIRPVPSLTPLTLVAGQAPATAPLTPAAPRPDPAIRGFGGQAALHAVADLAEDFGPRITPTAELPDAVTWAARLGLALVETSCGARPAVQVMRWVSPTVYESIVRRSARAVMRRRATRRPTRVRRVRVCSPADGVAECTVVVEDHHRVRALAFRMEGIDGRWIITDAHIG